MTTQRSLFEIKPDPEAMADAALTQIANGNLNGGEKILNKLLMEFPENDTVQYGMGVVCIMRKDYSKALVHFYRALQLNPEMFEAWSNIAVAHQQRNEVPEMIEAHQKVIALGVPGSPQFIQSKSILADITKSVKEKMKLTLERFVYLMKEANVADAEFEKKNYKKAIDYYSRVIAEMPGLVTLHGNLGLCYMMSGNDKQALKCFDRALEIDPKYPPAIKNRKKLLIRENNAKVQARSDISTDKTKKQSKATEKERIREKEERIIEMTTGFCNAMLDDDYNRLCRKLVKKLGQKRGSPFQRGKEEVWAVATIQAIGSINFLFDKSFEPYVSADELNEYFGTNKSTTSNKAAQIRNLLKMGYFDEEFSTRQMAGSNPMNNYVMVDGFIMPVSTLPPEMQDELRKERAEGYDLEFTTNPEE